MDLIQTIVVSSIIAGGLFYLYIVNAQYFPVKRLKEFLRIEPFVIEPGSVHDKRRLSEKTLIKTYRDYRVYLIPGEYWKSRVSYGLGTGMSVCTGIIRFGDGIYATVEDDHGVWWLSWVRTNNRLSKERCMDALMKSVEGQVDSFINYQNQSRQKEIDQKREFENTIKRCTE